MKKPTSAYKREQLRYAYAYVVAGALSFFAYIIVQGNMIEGYVLAAILLGAAALQLYIQSRYFLHLDDDGERPRWRLASYVFTWFTLLIVVVGSLWVMMNLNYNMMMSPKEMNEYMLKQNTKGF